MSIDHYLADYLTLAQHQFETIRNSYCEKIISTNATWSRNYAQFWIKDRFEKGESAILRNSHYKRLYIQFLNKIGDTITARELENT